jgi:peroxiredoxin
MPGSSEQGGNAGVGINKGSMSLCLLLNILILTSVFCILNTAESAENPPPYAAEKLIGKPAPDFVLKDIGGKPAGLSDSRGKVVLLVFWASWCPTSREEFISLNKLYSLYKDRGLAILAVSSDKSESAARDFIRQNPVSFQVLLDEKMRVSKSLYKAFMIPMAFLINRKGEITGKHFGEQGWTSHGIVREIESLL